MRKNYIFGILLLFLAFLNLSLYAQVSTPLNQTVFANDDVISTQINTPTVGNVLQNDYSTNNDMLTTIPQNITNLEGSLVLNADGSFIFNPSIGFIGQFTYNYTICNNVIPSECSTATLLIVIYEPYSFAVTLNGTYTDYNNDGNTNAGDIINFQINITNTSSNTITNIVTLPELLSLTSFTGQSILNLQPGETDNTTFAGIHVITQHDINRGYTTDTACFIGDNANQECFDSSSYILTNSTGIKLNAFIDLNNNGVQESNEQNFQYGNFNYTINNGTTSNVYSSSGISYLYESNPATIYNLSYTIPSQYSTTYQCSTTYSNVSVAANSGITTYNFPITITLNKDVAVHIYPSYSGLPRPGFQHANIVVLTNYGSQTIASGTLTFAKDPNVAIVSTTPNTIATSTGFNYNFTNLSPSQTRTIIVNMQVPTIPTVSLGQLLTNSVSVTSPIGDINLFNNNASLTQTIVGSYDPNDKTESHGGKILHSSFTANDYLNYTIRFENTGTANAINIKVEDILDSKLDETSIKMVASSHPYVLDRVGSNLKWNFNGVNLPPSVPDTQTGHGYIVFQVKPKPGFAIGDVIPNTANIYFDFNPAIVTNTCTTEFVSALANENFTFNNFKSFPNPVKNSLTISNASPIETIEISSILGQKMISKKVNDIQTEIDLSQLSNGIYFVKVTSQGNEKTIKIIKE